MRWMWIDRFVEFRSGSRAVAVKNVTLAEEHLHDHFAAWPMMPPALMIEGMAQTAGILAGEARGFKENVILAKIRSAAFSTYAVPGDQIRYEADLATIDEHAASSTGVVRINGEQAGTVDLLFSHVGPASPVKGLPAHNFVFTEQFMRLFRTTVQFAAGSQKGSP